MNESKEILADETPLSAGATKIISPALLEKLERQIAPLRDIDTVSMKRSEGLRLIYGIKAHRAEIAVQSDALTVLRRGIESRDAVIARQAAEIEALVSALRLMHGMGGSVFASYDDSLYDPAMNAAEAALANYPQNEVPA